MNLEQRNKEKTVTNISQQAERRDEFSSLQLISDLSTVNSNNTPISSEDKTIDEFLDQKEKKRVSNMIREKNREKKLQCELTENL